MHPPNEFVLHGGDTAFANRQKLLFDKLSVAEKECNKNKSSPVSADIDVEVCETSKIQHNSRPSLKRKHETKRFRGKESIFKRPEGPAPRAICRSVPDHLRNPHKWMKYSLGDVSNEDMTDDSNTKAALSFLKELKTRKEKEQADHSQERMDLDEVVHEQINDRVQVTFRPRKIKTYSDIKFKKPDTKLEEAETLPVVVDQDDKPTFRNSKVIMPEYVVGQKQKKKTKQEKSAVKADRLKQLKLDHLEELNDEEED